jgi:HlyD family secretion protein
MEGSVSTRAAPSSGRIDAPMRWRRYGWLAVAVLAALALAVSLWHSRGTPTPEGFARGNGRIEGTEIDVATKHASRIREILVEDGEFVEEDQVVARLDTRTLLASLSEAHARVEEARHARVAAIAIVAQRESEVAAAAALLVQRQGESDVARKKLDRSRILVEKHSVSAQQHDENVAAAQSARAAVAAARAQLGAAQSGVDASRALVVQAESTIVAATAGVDSIQADIDDSELRAPRAGRVQYRIAQPGEVLAPGGKVLSLLDTGDVYMTFFLPEIDAGRVAMGADVRLVLDAAPEYVIPATVSYVASVAQFTPKTVETESERQKLMFRVRARIAPELLDTYRQAVKTGLPGVAHVRLDPEARWPAHLETKLPR